MRHPGFLPVLLFDYEMQPTGSSETSIDFQRLHGVMSYETEPFVRTAVRILNPTKGISIILFYKIISLVRFQDHMSSSSYPLW
jgi:hypothetical protein